MSQGRYIAARAFEEQERRNSPQEEAELTARRWTQYHEAMNIINKCGHGQAEPQHQQMSTVVDGPLRPATVKCVPPSAEDVHAHVEFEGADAEELWHVRHRFMLWSSDAPEKYVWSSIYPGTPEKPAFFKVRPADKPAGFFDKVAAVVKLARFWK